jgi:hypothetical protein
MDIEHPHKNPHNFTMRFSSVHRQSGFLLPLALFMIIAAGGLALLMSRQATQVSTLRVLDIAARNSLYTAETGAQLAANRVLFPSSARQQSDARCQSLAIDQHFLLEGLSQCRIRVACTCRYENNQLCVSTNIANYNGAAGIDDSFYQIDSTATCGSGVYRGQHQYRLIKVFP